MVGTTKYTEEQIHFILDRTVKIIPRGETSRLHDQVVEEYKERFGVEDFGANQVRYVTERYGTDPVYGNRWANIVKGQGISPTSHPLSSDLPRTDKAMPGANQTLHRGDSGERVVCRHCNGLGTVPINPPPNSRLGLGIRDTAAQLQSQETRAIEYPSYRPQSYRPTPDHLTPIEQPPFPSYQPQNIQNIQSRVHRPSSTPGPSTDTVSTAAVNRDAEISGLPRGSGFGFGSERPIGPIGPLDASYNGQQHLRDNRIRQTMHNSPEGHLIFPSQPTTTVTSTSRAVSQPASSALGFRYGGYNAPFSSDASRSTPYYSVPTTSGTTNNTPMPQAFYPRAPDASRIPGFEMRPLGPSATAPEISSSTMLDKHRRSASINSMPNPTENAPTPISMQSPYQWQNDTDTSITVTWSQTGFEAREGFSAGLNTLEISEFPKNEKGRRLNTLSWALDGNRTIRGTIASIYQEVSGSGMLSRRSRQFTLITAAALPKEMRMKKALNGEESNGQALCRKEMLKEMEVLRGEKEKTSMSSLRYGWLRPHGSAQPLENTSTA
ncbi:hypothetical protein F4861DRAFT_551961 [Xylaria intraflava]|nr:hypothetical protein F4861DRAFT_551961 [Xylaria intraflava]